ncbi:hypothetical protein TNCV_1801541 [Trichonephila clavipes]|nr:hypothetical protein TNCV_1801541 [Trichonephila clavipes]
MVHRNASEAEIRAPFGTTVIQRNVRIKTCYFSGTAPSQAHSSLYSTVSQPLLFATPVVSSQSSLDDGVEVCFFSGKSTFGLCVSNDRVLVRRRPWVRLQQNCMQSRHTGPTTRVMF